MPRNVVVCALAVVAFVLPSRAGQPTARPETLIRLSVSPAPAPKPALRYLLLPELKEMNPGNPIQSYIKCAMEHHQFFFDRDAFERREQLLDMPFQQLPASKLENYGRSALEQVDRAARQDAPDWQILLRLKSEGVNVLIPDVHEMRGLARALQVRFRAEVALGRFDQALRTAQTLFAMARHLSEHPTYVGDLIGMAIAATAIGPLEEMLEQPGCPNLYWALTNLPSPFVPLDRGTEGERVWVLLEFRDLDEISPMSAAQLEKAIAHFDKLFFLQESENQGKRVRAWLDARTKDEGKLTAARRRLVESGFPEERLLRFPADQVILLDEKREMEVRRDEFMKLVNLPAWQLEAMTDQTSPPKKPSLFADALLTGLINVPRQRARLDQRIALLRYVEAVRLYAAEHRGALPSKLCEISVPLPDDPFTGKPFRYSVDGRTAHLRGSPPRSLEKEAAFNVHYELTVRN